MNSYQLGLLGGAMGWTFNLWVTKENYTALMAGISLAAIAVLEVLK